MNHYMLPHLIKNRESDKFRGFSYRKKIKTYVRINYLKSTGKERKIPSAKIAWDVFYQDTFLTECATLTEVKHYIKEKANT